MTTLKRPFLAAALFSCTILGTPAIATTPAILDGLSGIESGGNYSACNCDNGNSALGRYQIIASNWVNAGYVTFPNGGNNWDDAVFTSRAQSMGVYSVDDLLNTSNGAAMQDSMASDLAMDMWDSLNSNAIGSLNGGTIAGVPATEGSIMAATWMLGPGAMNDWANSGFSVEGLANLDNIDAILSANGMSSPEELYAHLQERMARLEGLDLSDLTDGTYEIETILECEPDVSRMMRDEGQAYVDQVVSAAQDETLGFSMLNENFGEMSCMEAIFNGGLSVMFSVPDLSGILDSAIAAVCSEVQNRFADLNSQINSKISETVNNSAGGAIGFGPFSTTAGASASFVPNGRGINFGVTSSDVSIDLSGDGSSGSGSGSIGGSYNAPESSGFDGLFQ